MRHCYLLYEYLIHHSASHHFENDNVDRATDRLSLKSEAESTPSLGAVIGWTLKSPWPGFWKKGTWKRGELGTWKNVLFFFSWNGRLSVSISLEEKISLAQRADGNPDRSLIDGWSGILRDHWLCNYLCVRLFYSDGPQSRSVCGEGGARTEGNRWFKTFVQKSLSWVSSAC